MRSSKPAEVGELALRLFLGSEEEAPQLLHQELLRGGVEEVQRVMIDQLLLGLEPLRPADHADRVEELLTELVLERLEPHAGALLAAPGTGDGVVIHCMKISGERVNADYSARVSRRVSRPSLWRTTRCRSPRRKIRITIPGIERSGRVVSFHPSTTSPRAIPSATATFTSSHSTVVLPPTARIAASCSARNGSS